MRSGVINWVPEFIPLKGADWFEKQKVAGQTVAKCLFFAKNLIEDKTPNVSLKDIEAECHKIIMEAGCTPTFKNYKGFPGAICTSVNKQMVHGIPTDYILKEGDVVKVDLGATFEGAIGDAAITAIYGKAKDYRHIEMVRLCKKALYAGIQALRDRREENTKLGCIGNAIFQTVRKSPYKLITHYGGHGLSWNTPHSAPFVPNKSSNNEGVRIQEGMTIAIEPMLAMDSSKTKRAKDNWTVLTKGVSCHWEHTVFVGPDKIHVMTDWERLYDEN